VLIYACDVKGALCIDWLRFTIFQVFSGLKSYFKYGPSKGSISQKKRERVVVGFW